MCFVIGMNHLQCTLYNVHQGYFPLYKPCTMYIMCIVCCLTIYNVHQVYCLLYKPCTMYIRFIARGINHVQCTSSVFIVHCKDHVQCTSGLLFWRHYPLTSEYFQQLLNCTFYNVRIVNCINYTQMYMRFIVLSAL